MGVSARVTKEAEAEIAKIAKTNKGELTPDAIVKWAKSHPNSALYQQFTWDDSEAARLYRLETAKHIIRLSVRIVEHPREIVHLGVRCIAPAVKTRSYVALSDDRKPNGETVYRKIETVLSDEDMRKSMLMDAYSELLAFRRKYLVLSELAQVFAAIESVKVKIAEEHAA
jgi:hypothetical protein